MSLQRKMRLAVVAGAAMAIAAACAPPGSGGPTGQSSDRPAGSISTDPAKAGQVTLNVWDQEVRGGQNAEVAQLNKEFQAKYPNVKIVRTSKSFSDLKNDSPARALRQQSTGRRRGEPGLSRHGDLRQGRHAHLDGRLRRRLRLGQAISESTA
ncbi:hypothetical protein [Fodinicola feengrottensis]|uniref:hypothetical protein n=1 Tax=Fodinicola feengrottensis TaxID=435914 RepID=UPI0024422B9D|nr:hypothetical protein [Fodinicola feengrottensis]